MVKLSPDRYTNIPAISTSADQRCSAGNIHAQFVYVLLLLVMLALPVLAVYPAPWPDSGSASVTTNWSYYTMLGQPIKDNAGNTDKSTGGTNPTQDSDIISNNSTLPSLYIAYDKTNQVLFARVRIANSPLTQTPVGDSGDDPFDAVTWSMLVDCDGDGFKEFAMQLNGDTGTNTDKTDYITVYYDNTRTQALTTATVSFKTKCAAFPESDPRTDVYDYGRSRAIAPALTGGGWFIDWQIPLSAFMVNGTQIITGTTPISLGFATSNSNTNPLQKDVAYAGDFVATNNIPFPFGDGGTIDGGFTQNPYDISLTATGCGPTTINTVVMDTLLVQNSLVVSTIANVAFYYQQDFNGDNIPDSGTSPVLIAQPTSPNGSDVTLWTATWNNQTLLNGNYLVWVVATDQQGNATTSSKIPFTVTCGLPNTLVAGKVYFDINHNGYFDTGEVGTGITPLYVKLVPAAGGSAIKAVAPDQSTGEYLFTGVSSGTYNIILDNNDTLTDTTPSLPTGCIGTEAPTQQRSGIVVTTANINSQNFGLFRGGMLSGTVFKDLGTGGGVANDGVINGSESGIAGVTIKVTDDAGTVTYDTAMTSTSGAYILWIPYTAGATYLKTVEVNATGYTSIGAQVGNTGGTYTCLTDTIRFSNVIGTNYTGVNFADVPINTFSNDGQQTVTPGSVAIYPHVFTAGTSGQLTFTTSDISVPAITGWSSTVFRDMNMNGVLDAGDTQITGPISVIANDQIYLLVKVLVPTNAIDNTTDTLTLTANFTYANTSPAVTDFQTHTDLTIVASHAGLTLSKTADKASAKSGDTITYTITYRNASDMSLSNLVISDMTPAYTTYMSAANGTLPLNLTGCVITAPAVGAFGPVHWTFAGTLAPGNSGVVTFVVQLR